MINAIILEDELKNAVVLSRMLQTGFPEIKIVNTFPDVTSATCFLKKNLVQLIFMDIMLSDGCSFELFDEVDLKGTHIIFITAYDQFAIKAIKFSALDYLLKPIDIDELNEAVSKALVRIKRSEDSGHQLNVFNLNIKKITKVILPSTEGHAFVNIDDIYYLQSDGAYTTFYMKDNIKHLVSRHIKEYEELFEDNGFFRIHQSYIVNLQYIKKYIKGSGGTVIMDNGKEIDVAVRRKEEFLKKTHIH